jgi:glycosyltransferase involved in cell wall biosynthesis
MIAMAKMAPSEPAVRRPTLLHFIASIDGGGAESLLRSLVERMDRRRWRVVVVAVDGRPWPEAAEFLQSHCDAYHDLESSAYLQKPTLSKLKKLLQTEKPTVVQTWMHHADLVGGIMARLSGVPKIIWSLHCREIHRSPGASDLKVALLRTVLGITSRFLPATIVSCSQAAIDDHRKLGYPISTMKWIPNGVDPERFVHSLKARQRLREELGIPERAAVIGFVGRFHEMKDLPTLFTAIRWMQQKVPDTHFVLCGGTAADLDEATHHQWREIPTIECVHFIPFRPDPESLYPAMDVFTLTSRTEACPMTILESMSCGVPCVTSDVGDCGRLLGDTGSLVPVGDSKGFQRAWSALLAAPAEEKADLQQRVRSRVIEHFTIDQAAASYDQLYQEFAARTKS